MDCFRGLGEAWARLQSARGPPVSSCRRTRRQVGAGAPRTPAIIPAVAKVDGAEARVVLRSTTRWVVGGIYAFIAAAGCFGLAFGTAGALKNTLVIIAIAVFSVLAFRGVRSSIEVDQEGLTARADRFTRRLHWSDVDRFEIRAVGLSTALGAWKKDGSWLRLMDRGYDSRQRYESALQDLQAELTRRR